MIELRMLGAVELIGDDGKEASAVVAQPKRLALLAYLGAARPYGFHRRDTLLALFWPELDQTHARRALNRSVYFLRGQLGDGVILSRGAEELGVARDRLWCDVRAFDDAVGSERLETALTLYRGDLLVGVFCESAPGFVRWLEGQRESLRTRAATAARALAARHESGGSYTPAIGWARRAADYAPDDERALRRLISILEKAGDRAGAVRAYEAFAARLAAELGITPSAETRAMLARLTEQSGSPPSRRS
jgi:DNA-binding SARP family transcriptional activator